MLFFIEQRNIGVRPFVALALRSTRPIAVVARGKVGRPKSPAVKKLFALILWTNSFATRL